MNHFINHSRSKTPWFIGLKHSFFTTILVLAASSSVFGASANLSWDANTESDLSGYKVYMGTASGSYGSPISVGNTTTYAATGLADGTYFFAVTAIDTSGNESGFSNEASKTISTTDSTPPLISSIAASSITSSSATISWTTDEVSDTQIQYGTTTSYGSTTGLNPSLTTNHSQGLSGLASSTLYHYRVLSRDAAGNLTTSADNTFTTASSVDTTPPSISGVVTSSISTSGATVSWTTNEASDAQVEYGTTSAYGSASALDTTLATGHNIDLSGLTSNTTYHFRVLSRDAAGNLASSGNLTFMTLDVPDTTSPVLSGITASGLTATGAIITWSTDEGASSQVDYGTTSAYGSSTAKSTSLVTSHSRTLSGLSAATTYHYQVRSSDDAGNEAISGNGTFTTPTSPNDTTPPVLSNVAADNVTSIGAIITWSTNEAATSQVEYGTTTVYGSLSAKNTTLVTSHSRSLSGLSASTTYNYRLISVDAAGNQVTGANRSFTTASADLNGPTLSNISAGNISETSATITWVTDESASSQVEYGTTSSYGSSSSLNATLLFSHSTTLSGLEAGTTYNYRVLSRDANGNLSVSGNNTFKTAAAVETIPPDTTAPSDVVDFSAVGQDRSVLLSWINPTDSDFVGVRIRFRTDRFPEDINDGTLLGDISGDPDQQMRMNHTDLTNGITYFYLAASYDGSGNFQTTVFVSASPKAVTVQANGGGETSGGGGGCGMIRPGDGNPPGPGDSAAMLTLVGLIFLTLLKKISKSTPERLFAKNGVIRI